MYNTAIESVLECMECFLYRIHIMCSLYNVIYKNSRVIYKKLPEGHKIKKYRNRVCEVLGNLNCHIASTTRCMQL
jgi:hypothetical protein